MKRTRNLWKALLAVFVVAVIALALPGCPRGGDSHHKGEHPAGVEHPKKEHPDKGEHPKKDKDSAKTEHPEHPE